MPFPSAASYTQTKWLAFFAELTAKLTHHNVLVAMEGAELLKRLLISRVSIAAVLQQGDLLVRVLDSWRGCVTAVRPQAAYGAGGDGVAAPSAVASLNDELGFVLSESISQCIDLMWSLYADGDPYYCLLVLARAGPMLEVLVDVLHTAPPQMYGITASLLQQLLALPLGHSDVELKVSPDGEVEGFAGLDKATLAQIQKSVALRRHVRGLVEAVQEHGALLQHTTDVLAGLLAVQQGPRCLAAVFLFNLAAKRLRKFELRNASTSAEASPSPSLARGRVYVGSETQERTADNSELNVTITGAPQMPLSASAAGAATRTAQSTAAAASALDDLEEGVESSMPSTEPSALGEPAAQAAVKGAGTPSPSRPGGDQTQRPNSGSGAAADKKAWKQAEHAPPQDVSALVDDEPTRYSCTVPPSLAEETLRHLADSSNHDGFFDALDWLWCLTVADPMVIGAALTPAVFTRGLSRYLKAVPRTRRDCILFTLLLLWLGHLHSISALRRDTHRCLLEVAAASLLPMLHSELSKGSSAPAGQAATPSNASLNVSAIAPTMGASRATSAMALATSTGYSVPNPETNSFFVSASGLGLPRAGQAAPYAPDVMSWSSAEREAAMSANPPIGGEATLLPYAAARKAQEAALLLRPSIELILMAFLLNIYPGIEAEVRRAWVCQGRVLDMALTAVRRAGGVQSALLDTPTTIDGALSDEVYLDHALRSVRTDVTTVAVLGCRLMASVLSSELRWGSAWHDTVQEKKSALGTEVASTESESITAAATQAEVALFTQAAMPLLVHIAVHNPDVSAAREGGAASPVHHVPLNLRCTRYTSLGESALVALDACLQYTAQMGDLRSRGGPAAAADATHITIEDVVRVLPALTRVSRNSVHPPVRAVPYRCLLYISQRIEDVLVVLRDMPSLANAAVSCVLDYSAVSSQWEVAAAAEWLTVLVDLLTAAEVAAASKLAKETAPPNVDTTHIGSAEDADAGTKQQRRLFAMASSTEQLLEYFHFDDSPLSRKLLTTIVSARRSNTGSVYAMSALLQLAVHLQTYVLAHQSTRQAINKRQRACANEAEKVREVVEESVVQPLTPAGLSSIPQWILLLQSTTAENARLSRICAAFHRSRQRQRKEEDEEAAADGGGREGPASFEDAATVKVHRQASYKAVLRDAWVRGVTASEQIALQYTFTATLFRALDMVLRSQYSSATASYGKHFSKALICGAVSAAVTLPPPHAVATLLAMRFHAATAPTSSTSSPLASSPALVFGYQAAIQWACCAGSKWLRSAYPCGSGGGGLPDACKAALVEDFCTASETIMRDAALHLSERTRCQAATLLSAVIEACPASHLTVLEARGADLFSASTALRRTPGVSGLQCRLLRRVGSAARYAACAEQGWLQRNLEALRSTVERVKDAAPALVASAENHRAGSPRRSGIGNRALRRDHTPAPSDAASMARDLQAFQVLTSLLTSLVACVGDLTTSSAFSSFVGAVPQPAALLTAPQRQELCAVLCDALRVTSLRHCVLTSLRGMAETAEGRYCLLTDISTAGDPLGRNLFGRVLALTLHIPCKWAGISKGSHLPFTASPLSPSSTQQQQQQRSAPHRSSSASPRSLSPPLQSPRTPRAEKDTCHDAATDADPVVVVGCDICTTLLGRGCTSDAVSPSQESNVDTPTAVPNFSFLASFMKHRGLEYLAEHVALCVQQQRRHVRRGAVPQHFLRLLAALSLQVSVMGSIVKSADLFSAVLELAGMASPPHCRTATLALLTLRNVCFDASLKSVLCQDDRVLLTLKAACLKLPCVSALLEDAPAASSSPAGQSKAAVEARASPNLRGGRRTRTEVMLRGDVVDPDNATAVTWATQMCVCARAWRSDAASVLNAEVADKPKGATSGASSSRAFFGDVTNTSPHAMMMDISALSLELNGKGETAAMAVATDAEATRRQYLAASALASLWFDHQRGKVAITDLLSAAPPLALADVQALARFA